MLELCCLVLSMNGADGGGYVVQQGGAEHLPYLERIEREAAGIFPPGLFPPHLAADTTPAEVFRDAIGRGWLLVALTKGGQETVGFGLFGVDDGCAFIRELQVLPSHGRRGLGTRLVHGLIDIARRNGHDRLFLTTFRDIPWNAPMYARLGFSVLHAPLMPRPIRRMLDHQRNLGFVDRVAMAMTLAPAD